MMVPATPSSEERDSGSHYPLDGVYQDWDNMAEVRKRIRWNKNLIQHVDPQTSQPTNEYVEKTLANLRENRVQLKPMFHRTRAHQLQLPMIDGVIEEIRNLYMASKITVSYDFLYQQAWAVRRMLSLAKNTLLYKKYLSEDRSLFFICFL
ncbi:unnamed protein product [Durusdinium trenchii]|uniref:Uncharacterized protein n=1 Tax=Durusdinium trenchii TaxID=1381693 RepID=A0ABP0I819_9DINO